jgi:LacI family gluconate utilization system Gnt-I transcriptional repressor
MGAKVTMRDVAAAAGVSPMTVSRALKQDSSITEDTRKAVRAVADRLGYVYDTTAQAFRAQRSGFIAVTLPSVNNANFASTHRALTAQLKDTNLQILLGITNYSVDEEERLVRQLLARRPEAIVLTGGAHTDTTRRLLEALDIPVIEIWDKPVEPLGHVVGFSNADAMGLMVRHLAERGYRKLGFLGADGDSDQRGAERRRGAQAAAAQLGLPEIAQFTVGAAPATMTLGAAAVTDALAAVKALDALLCVSDPVAFGAMMSLQNAGLSVPGDIAITGFGNFEIARIARPGLTTVDVGAEDIGRKTAQAIISLCEEKGTVQDQTLEPKLIVRASQ